MFPAKNNYKCFGCGAHGNAISFVKAKENRTFPEACKLIGDKHNIKVIDKELTPEEQARHDHLESLYLVNKVAGDYFQSCLVDPINQTVMDYALSRWTKETIETFQIGLAENSWDGFMNYAIEKGHKPEILLAAGLLSESTKTPGKLFNFFKNRLIIPIMSRTNQIVGFTGRTMDGNKTKYMNTRETEIYKKGSLLFGMNFAYPSIKLEQNVYLVEGNADVIKLHQLGILNTVGICSTSFTLGQLDSLKDICSTITIIPDSDQAGEQSIDRSAKMIMDAGISCQIVKLPLGEEMTDEKGKVTHAKLDADSYFQTTEQFEKYSSENIIDYIISKAMRFCEKPRTPANKLRAVNEISDLIYQMGTGSHEMYIQLVSKLIPTKKIWLDRLKELVKEGTPEVDKEVKEAKQDRIPQHVSLVDWEKYGFYQNDNCYYFRTQKGVERGCNFTLEPLFHIESVTDAKRIFRITNEFKITRVIELPQNSLISLGRFKEAIESLGNFLWEMSDTELNKLKRYLYQETKSCIEIKQLGWHKDGFYAWGNGIFNEEFTKIDEYGIVSHAEVNYYLPAFSSIWEKELSHYQAERQFMHRDKNTITLQDYSARLITVFGDNAMVALCFYFASLFRDVIIGKLNCFPILDLFGPKGAGKTELAVSIMSFFGKMGKGPNINNTSKAALADHVSQLCNACAHIDEYKNSIELDKIEFLKGLWDGTGRTRMNMDKDKKKETTAVDCGVILSGQEMPTQDIALFSRLIYLTFNVYEYNDQAKQDFNNLKEIEKLGNTHITNEILALRTIFSKNFNASYDQASKDFQLAIGSAVIEDRIFKNWLIVIATYHAIQSEIEVAFDYKQLVKLSAIQVQIQNAETKKSSEISSFWQIVQFLASDGLIHDGIDYRIEMVHEIKTEGMASKREYSVATSLIFIQFSRIFQLYRKHGKMANEKILPIDSIQHYLSHDPRFLGKKRQRFRFLDKTASIEGIWRSKPEWASVFEYKDLGIDLSTDTIYFRYG
ncbi:MAG: toprim domain-containing protein [Porphyromonadaceae bacterium]|nr:MAG: toprim domain-containing protein [Porphyromonadaceae bacterium]